MESHTLREVYEHAFGQIPKGTCDDSHEIEEACDVGAGTVLGIRPDERRALVAVILDNPAEDEEGTRFSDVWTGWIASPYSEYASFWDIVYEDHDARFKMVHTWNIVTVCSHDATVLGKIDSARLQQIRQVFSAFIGSLDENEAIQYDESTDDTSHVVTGEPIEDESDLRLIFLEIYHGLAKELGRKAMESVQAGDRLASQDEGEVSDAGEMENVYSMALAAASSDRGRMDDVVAEGSAQESDSRDFESETFIVETAKGTLAFVYDDLGIHVHIMDSDDAVDTLLVERDGRSRRFVLVKSRIHEGLYLVEGMQKEDIESFLAEYKGQEDPSGANGYRISWEALGRGGP